MTETFAPAGSGAVGVATRRRLLVSWQHPESRRYHQVGWLTRTDAGYEFSYLPGVEGLSGFRPFLGFSDLARRYVSPHLFPLFTQRLLDPQRPDLPLILDALALDSDEPMEFLARSGGRRRGDTIELLPEPAVGDDGTTSCLFLVHGVRHQQAAGAVIDGLRPGDVLGLEPEPENRVNPRALVVTANGVALGWVPDPLLDFVHGLSDPQVQVIRANPGSLGHHLRLLVKLDGRLSV